MKRNRILKMVMAASCELPCHRSRRPQSQVQLTWFPPRVDEK